jgi:HPt (histidine-containing phosphotransfer) domain-containing protein
MSESQPKRVISPAQGVVPSSATDETAAGPDAALPACLPAPADAAPLVDDDVIAMLAKELTAALLPGLLSTFLEEAQARVEAIECAVSAGDWARAGALGHALKGSALTFGALALGARCAAIEKAGSADDGGQVQAHAADLRACAEHTMTALRGRVGDV